MGVIKTLKSSMEANGAKSSSVVMVLVAALAMVAVLVALFTNTFFGLRKPMISDLSEVFGTTVNILLCKSRPNDSFSMQLRW